MLRAASTSWARDRPYFPGARFTKAPSLARVFHRPYGCWLRRGTAGSCCRCRPRFCRRRSACRAAPYATVRNFQAREEIACLLEPVMQAAPQEWIDVPVPRGLGGADPNVRGVFADPRSGGGRRGGGRPSGRGAGAAPAILGGALVGWAGARRPPPMPGGTPRDPARARLPRRGRATAPRPRHLARGRRVTGAVASLGLTRPDWRLVHRRRLCQRLYMRQDRPAGDRVQGCAEAVTPGHGHGGRGSRGVGRDATDGAPDKRWPLSGSGRRGHGRRRASARRPFTPRVLAHAAVRGAGRPESGSHLDDRLHHAQPRMFSCTTPLWRPTASRRSSRGASSFSVSPDGMIHVHAARGLRHDGQPVRWKTAWSRSPSAGARGSLAGSSWRTRGICPSTRRRSPRWPSPRTVLEAGQAVE